MACNSKIFHSKSIFICLVLSIAELLKAFLGFQVHDDPLNAPVDGPTQWVSCCLPQLFRLIHIISSIFPFLWMVPVFFFSTRALNYVQYYLM